MDCPQCGGTLATYALSGREASVCEDCGYVGIAAEHRGDPRRIESWDDALRRFFRTHGGDEPSLELRPPLSRPGSEAEETWDDALRRFRDRQRGGEPDESSETDEEDEDGSGTESGDADVESEKEETAETADDADTPASRPPSKSQSSAGDS